MKVVVSIFSDVPFWTIPPADVERLRREFPDVDFVDARNEEDLSREIVLADVAFTSLLTPSLFNRAQRLRWVHSPAAGIGSMLFPAMVSSLVMMTNSRGIHAASTAEHVIGVMVMLARKLHLAVRRQAQHVWAQDELLGVRTPIRSLRGRQIGVVGLGAIGSEVARLASCLDMRVTAIKRSPARGRSGVAAIWSPDRLPDLLRESDVVVLTLPLTPSTIHLIGKAELDLMKPEGLLINVGRGRLINEATLIEALRRNAIGGAALDVFEHEPLSADSPLWDFPNVIITPHTAGIREDYWEAAVDQFAENLHRFRSEAPLLNVVDKQRGY